MSEEDYRELWDILESGASPTAPKSIRYMYCGRDELKESLEEEIRHFFQTRIGVKVITIQGERGLGKTFTARYLISLLKEKYQTIIPVYLSFNKITSPLDFLARLFYSLVFGIIPHVEEDRYKEKIHVILERFGVGITYAKIRPNEASPPFQEVQDLCDIMKDHGTKACIILDELDLLATPQFATRIHASLENLLAFHDNTAIEKMYVFCATQRAMDELRNLKGFGFISRIQSAFQNASIYTLQPLTSSEKRSIQEKVVEIFSNAFTIKVQNELESAFENQIKMKSSPRECITQIVELLKHYSEVHSLITESYHTVSSAITTGTRFDSIMKNRVLPHVAHIYSGIVHEKNPPYFPSILYDPSENRVIDSELIFPDGFRFGIEIKYTEHRSTIQKKDLDQVLSYLQGYSRQEHQDVEAAFILLGRFDNNPLSRELQDILEHQFPEFKEKIKFFKHASDTVTLNFIHCILLAIERASNSSQQRSLIYLLLAHFGLHSYLHQLLEEHRAPLEVEEESRTMPPIPRQETLDVVSLQPMKTTIKELKRKKKVQLKGLGSAGIDALKDAGIEYAEDFIQLDAQEIYQRLIPIKGKRSPKPYKIREWQDEIRKYLQKS